MIKREYMIALATVSVLVGSLFYGTITQATINETATSIAYLNNCSDSGDYRWLDIADQAYASDYQNSYNYSQATVEATYDAGADLSGTLIANNLKPNFAYQLKLVGNPGTIDNGRLGLVGRWWQEEWDGSSWSNGQNLNDKGNGSSPNPNDILYFERRYQEDGSSPTGYHYRYQGYLPFDYLITDSNGSRILNFETGDSYHVLWKLSQRDHTSDDGPIKSSTFDPDPSETAYDVDYPSNTVSLFSEWERLPYDDNHLLLGEYNCKIILTEESFHGSGGSLSGNWACAMGADISFTISGEPVGGTWIPVNKLELLAPYIGSTILLAVAVTTAGYVKKRKRRALKAPQPNQHCCALKTTPSEKKVIDAVLLHILLQFNIIS